MQEYGRLSSCIVPTPLQISAHAELNESQCMAQIVVNATGAGCMQVFAKCGVIKEGDDRKPRVKLYRDKALNVFKGDGLVTFLKEPSVSTLFPPPFSAHRAIAG